MPNETVVIGLSQTLALTAAAQKQLAFATSKALNETAKILQREVTTELLPKNFILAGKQRQARGAPWWRPGTYLGFNIKFANKNQGDNMYATLGSRADWLPIQELGGTKRAEGGRVAVPEGVRKSKFEIVPRRKRPRALITAGKAFVLKLKSGIDAVFERTGRGRGVLNLLYLLEPSVPIKPVLEFGKTTTEQATRIIGAIFEREFHKALASAKPAKS